MRLKEYLKKYKITRNEFAEKLNVSKMTVHNWIHGHYIPEKRYIFAIMAETSGEVTANDFFFHAISDRKNAVFTD